ncbi:hypothetical protein Q4493_13405 [Colwellia sp. 1_MG-2023]|uniref:hypothetical protein n=1 Tax=Colwellia sp. 1_MG-2023 TaxID=3062649 RepID=UPI0026E1C2C6|nr:hypothetical protein [Colwellia sp. 1_MG-2023]MDO6446775.1 hypothetical protein [Colwellia sp. 1_MG-2023]
MTDVNQQSTEFNRNALNQNELTEFDYDNSDLPRDFDIRIEKAEQREVFDIT